MQSLSLSVSLLAQSFCRLITHTAEQDPNQNTVWFELLRYGLPLPDMGLSTLLTFASLLTRSLRLLHSLEVQLTDRILIFFSGGIRR